MKPMKRNGGALHRINATKSRPSENAESLLGRGRFKAKRDAKAKAKIAKAGAPSRKERKGIKTQSKADAKTTRASKSGKAGEVIDKLTKTALTLSGKGAPEESINAVKEEQAEAEKMQASNKFNFMAWYMILIYLAIVALILYFVFKKK